MTRQIRSKKFGSFQCVEVLRNGNNSGNELNMMRKKGWENVEERCLRENKKRGVVLILFVALSKLTVISDRRKDKVFMNMKICTLKVDMYVCICMYACYICRSCIYLYACV